MLCSMQPWGSCAIQNGPFTSNRLDPIRATQADPNQVEAQALGGSGLQQIVISKGPQWLASTVRPNNMLLHPHATYICAASSRKWFHSKNRGI